MDDLKHISDPLLKLNELIEDKIDEFHKNTDDNHKLLELFSTIVLAMANDGNVLVPVAKPGKVLRSSDPQKAPEGGIEAQGTKSVPLPGQGEPYSISASCIVRITDDEGNVCMTAFTGYDKMEEAGIDGMSAMLYPLESLLVKSLEDDESEGILINPGEKNLFLGREVISLLLTKVRSQRSKPHVPGKDAIFTKPKSLPFGADELIQQFITNNHPEVKRVWLAGLKDDEGESLLVAVKTDSKETGVIFDHLNTMLNILDVPGPIDFIVCDEEPCPGAELIYGDKVNNKGILN